VGKEGFAAVYNSGSPFSVLALYFVHTQICNKKTLNLEKNLENELEIKF
jgi:hypothetical protein